MKPSQAAAYLFLALAWGLSFLVILRVVDAFGWAGAVSLRCLVAGMTMMAIARVLRRRLDFSIGWRRFAVVGATTVAAQLVGLSYGLPMIGTAMSAILVATIPLFSMLISQVWGVERITPHGRIGLVLGFAGIVMLVGFPAAPITTSFLVGCASTLFAAFAAAFGSNYASHRLRGVGSWEMTAAAFLLGGAITLPLMIVVPVPRTPGPVDFAFLLIAGCLMSALTYVLYFRLVATLGPTKAISVEFAVTLVAVLVGAFLLEERLSAMQVAGAAVIALGCAMVLGLIGKRPEKAGS